jgi:HlyD family secretion protein
MKRFILILMLAGVLGGGGYQLFLYWSKQSDTQQAQRIRTDTAKRRDLKSVVSASGEVLPLLNSVVKSEISGRIALLKVKEGAAVQKGDALLELDRTSLATRVREAERSLQAEQLRLDKAQRHHLRLKELFAQQFVGEKDYLDAQTDFELAQLNLEIAQARLDDAAEDLSKTTILAPHDGIVTRLDVVDGEVISGATSVSNGTDLLTIAQLKELYMEANINEVDVERLRLGQFAQLRFDAIPGFQIDGEIGVIALSARKDGNVRVFPIEVLFEATDSRVRPGISATVDVPIDAVEGAVSVLLSGVFSADDGSSYVFVKAGDSWQQRSVEIGINNLQHIEIKAGVTEGDVIALSRPRAFRKHD